MIALSDLVILTVSGTLLAVGIYRWQSNLPADVDTASVTQQRSVTPAPQSPAITAAPVPTRQAADAAPANRATVITTPSARTDTPQPRSESIPTITGSTPSSAISSAETGTDTASGSLTTDSTPAVSGTSGEGLFGRYTVVSGDTLSVIAEDHGTTVDTLRRINDIDGSLIYVGQEIRYPLPAN